MNEELEKLAEKAREHLIFDADVDKILELLRTAYTAGQNSCPEWHVKSQGDMVNPYQAGYTAGLERAVELLPKEVNWPVLKSQQKGFNECRSQASSAIQEEINKSKV